jgi:hypothetical protein
MALILADDPIGRYSPTERENYEQKFGGSTAPNGLNFYKVMIPPSARVQGLGNMDNWGPQVNSLETYCVAIQKDIDTLSPAEGQRLYISAKSGNPMCNLKPPPFIPVGGSEAVPFNTPAPSTAPTLSLPAPSSPDRDRTLEQAYGIAQSRANSFCMDTNQSSLSMETNTFETENAPSLLMVAGLLLGIHVIFSR